MTRNFSGIDTWLFDLDETLYPPHLALFDQIDVKMIEFVMAELGVDRAKADQLRYEYYVDHGTTLAGLMEKHGMTPYPFLDHVHEIELDHVEPDHKLAAAIDALPGRKLVYTNGSKGHAERVTKARGLDHLFDDMFGVEHAAFIPKPDRRAFEMIFDKAGITPSSTSFFEDTAKNLKEPAAMGVATVLVREDVDTPDFVDLHKDHLMDALTHIHDQISNATLAAISDRHD
ncbi:MAG: pyrimidine 5'-nucleotidase [Pseudomonadota bacterium]